MKITGIALKNVIVSAAILSASFMFSLLIQNLFSDQSLIPALFVLAVFLISLITGSYVCGIVSSFISVLAVN